MPRGAAWSCLIAVSGVGLDVVYHDEHRRSAHEAVLLSIVLMGCVTLAACVVGAADPPATLFPRVHRALTHLKTWLWDTHRGVSRKHLPHYL